MNKEYALGVDIGGSHLSSAVVNLSNGEICSDIITDPANSKAGAEEILSAWAANLKKALRAGKEYNIRQIGFAMPGPFDYDRGISLIEGVDKFESLFGMDVSASLRARLGASYDLRYVNDAASFGLGECRWGAAKNHKKIIALTLGTGVGSCFIQDHKALTEGKGVPENGYVYNLPFEDGIVDDKFSTRWVVKRYHEMTGKRISGALDVANDYGKRPEAKEFFQEYGRRLSDFLMPLMWDFGTDTVVLGGNIARNIEYFGPAMQENFERQGTKAQILLSRLFDKAAILGAASIFIKE
jgi:glucokinase